MRRSLPSRIFGVLLVCLSLAACGDSTPREGASCPNDLPKECPSLAPSYAADVAPILADHCLTCHAPGREKQDQPLDTYDHVYERRGAVMTQVYGCAMPPSGQPPLSPDERTTLLSWLVCGAKGE